MVGSAAPSPGSLLLPAGLLVAGVLVFAFGMFFQAPLSPSAVWSGVIDSLQVVPSEAPAIVGSGSPTRAVALYLPKAPAARVFRLPPASAALADSLHAGDTVKVILGWRSEADTAIAIRIQKNAGVLLDSTAVLAPDRSARSRTRLIGAVLALVGIAGLVRRKNAV